MGELVAEEGDAVIFADKDDAEEDEEGHEPHGSSLN